MTDTEHFVRDDVRGFLAMLEQLGGPKLEEISPEEGRMQARTLTQMTEMPALELPVIRDLTCPGPAGDIPLRLYDARETRNTGLVFVFFHGGGFTIGDLEVYHPLCTEIAKALDLPVVSVDYRLAPEHPFPAAADDCEAVARWVAGSPAELGYEVTGLVLSGDSAGGNLTIVTSHQLEADPAQVPVLVQAPIYPVADDVREHRSLELFGDGFFLTASTMAYFTAQYGGDPSDPRLTPMAGDCLSAPATVLCTAGLDPLRDSGRNYAAHLIQQGVDVAYLEFAGTIHNFIVMRKAIPSGQKDLKVFLEAIKLMVERQSRG